MTGGGVWGAAPHVCVESFPWPGLDASTKRVCVCVRRLGMVPGPPESSHGRCPLTRVSFSSCVHREGRQQGVREKEGGGEAWTQRGPRVEGRAGGAPGGCSQRQEHLGSSRRGTGSPAPPTGRLAQEQAQLNPPAEQRVPAEALASALCPTCHRDVLGRELPTGRWVTLQPLALALLPGTAVCEPRGKSPWRREGLGSQG